jgi:hypothetical protein
MAARSAETLCEELKTLAERLGVRVREETLLREVGYHARSGGCRVRGEAIVFLDRSLPAAERAGVLLDELRGYDLQGVYVSPAVRRLLERRGRGGAPAAGDAVAAGDS